MLKLVKKRAFQTLLWKSFHNIYAYQISTLHTFDLHDVRWQVYVNKPREKEFSTFILEEKQKPVVILTVLKAHSPTLECHWHHIGKHRTHVTVISHQVSRSHYF